MSELKSKKLQYLLITQLLEEGSVQLILPNGLKLDIGIVQEDKFGKLKKEDDYCYVVASRGDKSTMIDSYNCGLQYGSGSDIIISEDDSFDANGNMIKTIDVI